MVKCKIDNTEYPDRISMHGHLRKLKVKIADYYSEYEKRKSLLTNKPIIFKNVDQYLNSDFNSKEEAKKYFGILDKQHYSKACDWLQKRSQEKKLKYIPSWIELKTCYGPNIDIFDSFGWPLIGLSNRYSKEIFPMPQSQEISKIYIDTREKTPFEFLEYDIKKIRRKLDYGDYFNPENPFVYVERKSFLDGISTFTRNLDRFIKEIERAKKNNDLLIVVFEKSFDSYVNYKNFGKAKYVKTNPEHLFKNIREIMETYDNIQFVFASSPKKAEQLTYNLLGCEKFFLKNVDLQKHIYNKGLY